MATTTPLTWEQVNKKLMELSRSDDVRKLIEEEQVGLCRIDWLLRMQRRMNVLRKQEERAALSKGKLPWPLARS